MRISKWWFILTVVSLLGQQVGLIGCAGPNPIFRGTFKIGLIAPFSGQSSVIGYNMLFAAKLALKEWNESDRLKGYRVELIAQDDKNEAASGLMQAKKMVLDRDVLGVVGHPSSASALAAADAYDQARLAMITTEATTDGLSSRDRSTVFRLSASDSLILSESVRFFTALKAQRLAIVADPALEHIRYSERFYEMMKGEGLLLAFGEQLKQEQADFTDFARRMAATAPRGVVFTGDSVNAGSIVGHMRLQKMDGAFLVNMGAANPLFLKVAGASAEGSYVISLAPNPTDIPAASGFVQSYRALAGSDPLPSAVLTYDAVNVLLTAAERELSTQPRPTREGIVTALSATKDYPGLSMTLTFDDSGAALNRKVYIYRISGGRFPGDKQALPN